MSIFAARGVRPPGFRRASTRRFLARVLVAAALSVGFVVTHQAPAMAYDHCYKPLALDYKETKYVADDGKAREIDLYCYTGPGHPKLFLGAVSLWIQWDGDVYAQACDGFPDDVSPHIRVEFNSGAIYTYSDWGGSGDGCRTHRVGHNDTPQKWKFVANGVYLKQWWGTYSTRKTSNFVWPLHSL